VRGEALLQQQNSPALPKMNPWFRLRRAVFDERNCVVSSEHAERPVAAPDGKAR
jgi:hypothetical protein